MLGQSRSWLIIRWKKSHIRGCLPRHNMENRSSPSKKQHVQQGNLPKTFFDVCFNQTRPKQSTNNPFSQKITVKHHPCTVSRLHAAFQVNSSEERHGDMISLLQGYVNWECFFVFVNKRLCDIVSFETRNSEGKTCFTVL